MKYHDLYEQATQTWGVGFQLSMLAEECAELITACVHYMRDREGATEHLLEELVDVENMLNQIKHIMFLDDPARRDEFTRIKRNKMRRLADRINETRNMPVE